MDNTKPIRIIALVGLFLKIIQTVLTCAAYLVPEPLLRIFYSSGYDAAAIRTPVIFVLPLLSLGIYVLLYYVLMRQLKTDSRNAFGAALGTALWFLIVSPVSSVIGQFLLTRMFSIYYGIAVLSTFSMVNTILGYANIITGAASPALMIAAALIWYRERYLPH